MEWLVLSRGHFPLNHESWKEGYTNNLHLSKRFFQLHFQHTQNLLAHRQGYRVTQPVPIWRVGSPYNRVDMCSWEKKFKAQVTLVQILLKLDTWVLNGKEPRQPCGTVKLSEDWESSISETGTLPLNTTTCPWKWETRKGNESSSNHWFSEDNYVCFRDCAPWKFDE